jgi:7-cyano-7-deazaguanine reductase
MTPRFLPELTMPDPTLLETFATPSATPFVIEHIAEEFTSLCPVTGHPDFGVILLRYQPAAAGTPAGQHGCVELKSLKMYYQSFRNEGIFYEAVTNRIRDDLVALLKPAWLQVITNWKGRGGIRSVIRADHGPVPNCYLGQ